MHYLSPHSDSAGSLLLEKTKGHLEQAREHFRQTGKIFKRARELVPQHLPPWNRTELRNNLLFLSKRFARSSFNLDEFYDIGLETQTALSESVLSVEQLLPQDESSSPWLSVYTHQIHGHLMVAQSEIILALATLQEAVLTDPALVTENEELVKQEGGDAIH